MGREMMTTESTESIEFKAERAELEAVLHSQSFLRAPKLAHLLSYLCERLFTGETSQVKEYSIGVEVFQRGASFDQDSNSIVRVEANRLRRRLADYYATEGATHPLRISIPIGQYVPEFQKVAVPLPASQLPPPVSIDGSSPSLPGWKRWISRRSAYFLGGAVLLLFAGFTAGWFLMQQSRPAKPAASTTQSASASTEAQIGPPTGEEVRILCGSTRSMVDHGGKLWNADLAYTGGAPIVSSVQHIWRTQDSAFYRSSRQGTFRYDIPLKKGPYELRLHFAETVYGPESTGTGGEGSRIMTVRANGKTLLTRFDVVADAGASRTADVKVFPDIEPARDGQLHLEFAGDEGKATLSAIEIVPGLRGRIRPVRILARQTPYYSNDSQWWSPDAFFEGGQLTTYANPVSGTDDPELYDSERWGNFSYAIPVSPGKYAVTLRFAARHGDWPPGSGDSTAHIFNVFCNGKVLLQNFDLVKELRQSDVLVRRIAGLEPNAQGKLLLSFVPISGYATVTGIEVLPQ